MSMKDQAAIETLIDGWVQVQGLPREPALDAKIALLTFALEHLKHERRAPEDLVTFEEFTECTVFADTNKLVVAAPKFFKHLGTGTAAMQLQAPLLLFLLLHHREKFPVLEIIQLFISKIRDRLEYLDFKKTKTGVTRCYTNTRFAAKVLRAYGLLRFTEREAYKTWELSLTGFLVAADIYQKRCVAKTPWGVPANTKEFNFDLLPEIRQACEAIQSYDQFVNRLASLCRPDVEVFKAFEPALRNAYALLPSYWATINDPQQSQAERQKASLEHVKQLEAEGITEEFYADFVQCLQINDLLSKIPSTPTQE
jgi:hypothetical protein